MLGTDTVSEEVVPPQEYRVSTEVIDHPAMEEGPKPTISELS